jgi:hypothetical protein
MNERFESHRLAVQDVICSSNPWNAEGNLDGQSHLGISTMNVRSVEFIAKPHLVRDLRRCISEQVVTLLKQTAGFEGAVVLASHKEPRLVLVLTLWSTEKEATRNRWEETPAVRALVAPLIDACTKVHTYEAALGNDLPPNMPTSTIC